MVSGRLHALIRMLRLSARAGADAAGDGVLLQRFVKHRDDAAFAALVERYGPLVFGVCRRTLCNVCDAEDAFQATFLILARKAQSIAEPAALGGWLHRVALRVALRARAEAARRREQSAPLVELPTTMSAPAAETAEVRSVLDEEINRLPDKLRIAVVLCYFEGRTNEEAAHRLGCPIGTIASRLATARARLAPRLLRRGIVPSAAFAALLGTDALRAAVPDALAALTTKAALSGNASAFALTLAKGVLRTMLFTRIRMVIVVLLVLGLIGGGAGFFASQPGVDAHPQELPAGGGDKQASRLNELLRQRRDAAQVTVEIRLKRIEAGSALADEGFFGSALRLLEAERELCHTRAEHIRACEAHLERMNQAHAIAQAQLAAGKINLLDGSFAPYYRLDAEIRLERAKVK